MSETPDRRKHSGTDRSRRQDGVGAQGAGRQGAGKQGAGKRGAGKQGAGQPRAGQQSAGGKATGRQGAEGKRGDGRKLWTREGRPARGDRDAPREERELTEKEREARSLRSVRPRHDDPPIPDDVVPNQLPPAARVELKTLAKENAEEVARHLVMVARLIDDDAQLAHRHAVSAGRRAGRVGVVRETLGITAYATGDFAAALRELRTYRRITGRDDQLPLMVDSERGLGRPERALELGRTVDRSTLPAEVQANLAIAMSGARLDLGQAREALAELEIPQLDPDRAFSYSPALFRAYAEVLGDLRRDEDAALWRRRAEVAEAVLGDDGVDDEAIEIVEEQTPMDLGTRAQRDGDAEA